MDFNFSEVRILVLGDIMLDEYVYGRVSRVSPEAPVPVVDKESSFHVLGGAGNVAANIASIGSHCLLCGVLGEDEPGNLVRSMLRDSDIGLNWAPSSFTTVKTRIIGNSQQICRLDRDCFVEKVEQNFQADIQGLRKGILKVLSVLGGIDIIVLSDYGKGFLSSEFCQEVIVQAKAVGVPVLVDPKDGSWEKYSGANLIKPNLQELARQYSIPDIQNKTTSELKSYLLRVKSDFQVENVLLTRGSGGMLFVDSDDVFFSFPGVPIEVADVSGAGDTSISVLAVHLGLRLPFSVAVFYSNEAAAIVASRAGTSVITLEDIQKLRSKGE